MKQTRLKILFFAVCGLLSYATAFSQSAPNGWHSGQMHRSTLDGLKTQKTWNNIELQAGTYRWELETRSNKGKKGKVNLDIEVKFSSGPNSHPVNERVTPSSVRSGTFLIQDYMYRSGGGAGYGKIKIHIGRAGINTNCDYKITLTRIGGDPETGNETCTYTTLGGKSGNIVYNTRSTFTTTKKSCKNKVVLRVDKYSGKARTTFKVYSMNTPRGSKTLEQVEEFPNSRTPTSRTITLNNASGKFFFVELKNHSALNSFRYSATVTQSDN